MKKKIAIRWVESIDSTNSETLRQVGHIDNLSVLAAYCQTAGRGQRGNSWKSAPGDNLTFSLFVRFGSDGVPVLPASRQFVLNEVITLALTDFLLEEGIRADIKWPNDIYVRNKKLSGILIESALEGENMAWSVIGVGLNLNQTDFPAELLNPVSLCRLSGKKYALEDTLERIMELVPSYIEQTGSEEGREAMLEKYLSRLYRKGELCDYTDTSDGSVLKGRICGISPKGKLLVETGGIVKEFDFKEISYII